MSTNSKATESVAWVHNLREFNPEFLSEVNRASDRLSEVERLLAQRKAELTSAKRGLLATVRKCWTADEIAAAKVAR